jgi:hypothetical protein
MQDIGRRYPDCGYGGGFYKKNLSNGLERIMDSLFVILPLNLESDDPVGGAGERETPGTGQG